MKILTCAALLLLPASALAAGAALDPARLPDEARLHLQTEVIKARKTDPNAFATLARFAEQVPALDARKRGRLAPLTPRLRALGPNALLPMLEVLALESPGQGEWTASAWRAWRVALIEAVGSLRDPRARPVLEAIVRHGADDSHVLRAAALAFARYDDEASADLLLTESGRERSHRAAIVEGLGGSRQPIVAQGLSNLLDLPIETDVALAAVRALGRHGNAWAWETLPPTRQAEGRKSRAIAAEALVKAFVRYDGRIRETAGRELLVVAAPETPKLIETAKAGASPELTAALEDVAERFARLPKSKGR